MCSDAWLAASMAALPQDMLAGLQRVDEADRQRAERPQRLGQQAVGRMMRVASEQQRDCQHGGRHGQAGECHAETPGAAPARPRCAGRPSASAAASATTAAAVGLASAAALPNG